MAFARRNAHASTALWKKRPRMKKCPCRKKRLHPKGKTAECCLQALPISAIRVNNTMQMDKRSFSHSFGSFPNTQQMKPCFQHIDLALFAAHRISFIAAKGRKRF